MVDVFITSTFRNEWNRQFNLKLAELLNRNNISHYLPQRDTEQSGNRKRTFQENVAGLRASKVIVAIGSQTQTGNWGFEVGVAFSLQKPVIIVTDTEHPVCLMCEGAATEVIMAEQLDVIEYYAGELIAKLRQYCV